ncbi:FxsA family protein [Halomonas sp. ZH2S]|uniref:FxsA family protein n=1 Tax=Vreelandella zhuhanensis TaxID=2684210 RepID=A0A7X3GXI7_9GAMM|nr:FxsA family protein [Halomonas zhuhanensis]MWJ26732.1 FxsA family protein [Halomonas zhuhanensis]
MPILLFISLFTLIDFVILFSVGSQIGLLTTLVLILLTGVAGLHLIRKEGVATLARAKQRMNAGELPSGELLTGAALIFGGALLMAPGFLSDALGFACLIPAARQLLLKVLTWLGLRAGGKKRAPHHDQETNFTQRDRQPRREQEPHDQASASNSQPLEGDFISRDEPFHRR